MCTSHSWNLTHLIEVSTISISFLRVRQCIRLYDYQRNEWLPECFICICQGWQNGSFNKRIKVTEQQLFLFTTAELSASFSSLLQLKVCRCPLAQSFTVVRVWQQIGGDLQKSMTMFFNTVMRESKRNKITKKLLQQKPFIKNCFH